MTDVIQIVLVDDHPVVRDGLAAVLGTQADFQIVGEASDGKEALALAQELAPTVMLLDLEMPEMDGVELLAALRTCCKNVYALVFTAYDTDDRIVKAVEAGAKGYLLKGTPRDDIFHAIRVVSTGGSLLQPLVASKLMRHMSNQSAGEAVDSLTDREQDVLNLMAKGRANKEIAAELFITERTVKFHVSSILGKLGADNRTEAVAVAAQRGLVDLGS